MATGCIVILTLERHRDGVWIRRLTEELDALLSSRVQISNGRMMSTEPMSVEVRSLEHWMGQGLVVSGPNDHHSVFFGVAGIVNRVSDAAPPALFKACSAILTAAKSLGICIVNGPISYSLCANKWCQHILFQQAGLNAPPTKAFYNTETNPATLQRDNETERGGKDTTLLIKPNAGGFGAGITKIELIPDKLPVFEDGFTLLQRYIPPKEGKLYRVWFLAGRVQCAVERILQDGSDEFTGSCAAPTCSTRIRPPSSMNAYAVPSEVRQEIETRLLPLLPDAHCGSVEYLCSFSETKERRFYFDLNLLSTLPVRVSNDRTVWGDDYNPWNELAQSILNVVVQNKTTPAI